MNQIDLKNKRAVVTGSARGIGFGVAKRLLESGARVALWDVDETALTEAKAELGTLGEVRTCGLDLADPVAVQAAADETASAWDGLDILVNNAGITGGNAALWELSLSDWQRVMDVNLNAVFYTCRSVVPYLRVGGYGRIVNVASIAGKEGNPNASHYSVSKAGVIALTKSLGKELAQTEIRVNAVTPAVIRTGLLDQMTPEHINYMVSRIPVGRLGEIDEVAALVAWLCSGECSFSTGAVFDASGGRATY
ncbi:SDR family NAD(P)-dependent oxidoreductase [Synoicihabitans lomoniglobus]|uniref:SDR family NAD(P)-dependent oxidoreductase n=1 Tax=Synoicihabitans lomoniglobus TaxID=2909285 RepID=A0AAF0CPC8_9BACT|nr:SDR family oxidoreductase [Opitutaceae bacterium LMO-M01]WED64069.1 SDR family NAD(P)-dependent oxidoreductase [Opitutaceae bacterium LMO-M01]